MVTVSELTEPYGGFLVQPLKFGTGVCAVCHTAVEDGFDRCFPCNKASSDMPLGLADAVVPISIAIKREQFAVELWRYKNATDIATRKILSLRLAAVLWRFLAGHETCVATAARVAQFGVVTTVPSTGGRRDHPLSDIVGELVGATRDRYVDLLLPNTAVPAGRDVRGDRFLADNSVDVDLRGESVLLIDDTWTQGGHAQSASCALKRAGALRVAVVVLGRHFDQDFKNNAAYLREARKSAYSWDSCCVHAEGLW